MELTLGVGVGVRVEVEEGTAVGGGGGTKNWTSPRKTQDKVEFVSKLNTRK